MELTIEGQIEVLETDIAELRECGTLRGVVYKDTYSIIREKIQELGIVKNVSTHMEGR